MEKKIIKTNKLINVGNKKRKYFYGLANIVYSFCLV